MLSKDRYTQANASLAYAVEQRTLLQANRANWAYYASEHFRTQLALNSMNTGLTTNPSEIPNINTLYLPKITVDYNNPVIICVIGMPKAAKSTFIRIREDNDYIPVKIFGEQVGLIKRMLDLSGKFDYERLAKQSRAIQIFDVYSFLEYNSLVVNHNKTLGIDHLESPETGIFDRDWTDIPMLRANFLFGRITPNFLIEVESNHLNDLEHFSEHARLGIINLMVPPQESLAREGERKPGRIMNLPFLQVLYEQYQRFHYESINFQRRNKGNRSARSETVLK